jgi:hypothetical protein
LRARNAFSAAVSSSCYSSSATISSRLNDAARSFTVMPSFYDTRLRLLCYSGQQHRMRFARLRFRDPDGNQNFPAPAAS